MCGIIGAAGNLYKKEKNALQTLFYLNTIRGIDGCGIFSLFDDWNKGKKKSMYHLSKFKEPSSEIAFSKDWDDFVDKTSLKVMIGHSRAATKGEKITENNHPFLAGDIVGVHNGTIHGKFGDKTHKFGTDSEAFFNEIAEHGLKKALDIVHEDSYSAAYAIVYYDLLTKTITLFRNSQRPLYLARVNGDFFWASEKEMLEFALVRAGLKDYKIDEIPVHTLVRIFLDKTEPKDRLKIIPNYFTPKPRVYSQNRYYDNDDTYYKNRQVTVVSSWENNKKKEKENKEDKEHSNFSQDLFGGEEKEKYGKIVKVSNHVYLATKWLEKHVIPKGCANCGNPQHDYNKIRFNYAGSEYYCEDCKEQLTPYGVIYDELFKPEIQ